MLVAVFLFWESRRPFIRRSTTKQGARHTSHLLLMVINQPVSMALAWLIVWSFAGHISLYEWGLLYAVELSEIASVVAGFLLLDLAQYLRHRLMHSGWLWRVHQVHHSDADMDWSTQLRFHPVEIIVSTCITFFAVALFGLSSEVIALYAVSVMAIGILQHANIQLPSLVESVVGKVLITPALHRVHHADHRDCYDRNFAVIFVWWDWLFRTYRRPQNERVFGLPQYPDEGHDLSDLISSPFRASRFDNSELER